MKQAIFETILAAADPVKGLPETFHLPTNDVADDMRFLDGAKDGICLYHMQPKEVHFEEEYSEAMYSIVAGDSFKANKLLSDKFALMNFPGMPDLIDPMTQWIQRRTELFSNPEVIRYAVMTMTTTDDRELVKFCLVLLSLYDIDPKGEIAKMIRVLAMSDEFTYYALRIMVLWEKPQAEIYEVARKVHGWGRIHAVNLLDPANAEQRSWMLTEGWHNSVNISYSTADIARKLQLLKIVMKNDLTDDEIRGICGIMDGLMTEDRMAGISRRDDKEILMDAFLKAVNGHMLTKEGVDAVSKIRQYREKK